MAARGCGASRTAGGIYIEVPLSPYGKPIEDFLVDPPVRIDKVTFGLSPVGVKPIPRDGVYHVFDWVGSEYYPNVADFIEEVKRLGLSRRIPKTFNFSLLSMESRIILLHSKGWDNNHELYITDAKCPKCNKEHDHPRIRPMCVKLYWENIDGGTPTAQNIGERFVIRSMPAFQYLGRSKPDYIEEPSYELAVFLSLPIYNIVVVKDNDCGKHEEAMDLLSGCKVPVNLVDE